MLAAAETVYADTDISFFVFCRKNAKISHRAVRLRDCPTEAIVLENNYELSFYDRASAIYTKEMLIVDVPINGQPTPQVVEPGQFDRAIPDMEDPK